MSLFDVSNGGKGLNGLRYWRRRKPGSSTAMHYASDVHIFFKWINGKTPKSISIHDVDEFIE